MFRPKVIACEKCYDLVDTREEPESDVEGVTLCKKCREELEEGSDSISTNKANKKVINFL